MASTAPTTSATASASSDAESACRPVTSDGVEVEPGALAQLGDDLRRRQEDELAHVERPDEHLPQPAEHGDADDASRTSRCAPLTRHARGVDRIVGTLAEQGSQAPGEREELGVVLDLGCRGRGSVIGSMPTMRPGRFDSTTTRSDRKTASAIEWVTNTIVVDSDSQSRARRWRMSARVISSRAANGSSISSSGAPSAIARTSATRCCMPPESSCG